MNSRGRFLATLRHEPVDRPPLMEFGYWDETIERWRGEGLPSSFAPVTGSNQPDPLANYLGLDFHWLSCILDFNNNSPVPAFEKVILAQDDATITERGEDGVVSRKLRTGSSVPQYVSFPVTSRHDLEHMLQRFDPYSPERFATNWPEFVKLNRQGDLPLGLNINGFFGQIRNWMGFENLSFAYHDQPDLVSEMCEFWADYSVKICNRILDEVELDFIHFWEDMAYNQGAMVSPAHFRRFMLPGYRKVIHCARRRGVDIFVVDSDGYVMDLVPLLLEAGINAILPVEIAAGNNLLTITKLYPRLALIGGVDKRVLARTPEATQQELLKHTVPAVLQGGCIPALDHLCPPDVSLENYRRYVQMKREMLV